MEDGYIRDFFLSEDSNLNGMVDNHMKSEDDLMPEYNDNLRKDGLIYLRDSACPYANIFYRKITSLEKEKLDRVESYSDAESESTAVPLSVISGIRKGDLNHFKSTSHAIKKPSASGIDASYPTITDQIPAGTSLLRSANPNLMSQSKQSTNSSSKSLTSKFRDLTTKSCSSKTYSQMSDMSVELNTNLKLKTSNVGSSNIGDIQMKELKIHADLSEIPESELLEYSENISPYSSPQWENNRMYHMTDHCYTRLQDSTDSASEEEIDVVSDSIRKFPTNPSAEVRRVLQSRVTNKLTVDGIANTSSQEPVTGSHSACNLTFAASPNKLPNCSDDSKSADTISVYNHSDISSNSSDVSVLSVESSTQQKKRKYKAIQNDCSGENTSTTKRHRFKARTPIANGEKCHDVNSSEYLQKRTLHNSMERQRRVSLRAMFSTLKNAVPSCKNKERAPKVLILREATKYALHLKKEEIDTRDSMENTLARVEEKRMVLEAKRRKLANHVYRKVLGL